MTDAAYATTGDNFPPEDVDPLHDRLLETHSPLVSRRDDLLEAIERAPEVIDDEETAGKMGDFSVKQIAACLKAMEGARVAEKEPYLSGGRSVDGFFHGIASPLEKGKKTIDARRTVFARKKTEAERLERMRIEREAHEEAERVADLAATAEANMSDDAGVDEAIVAQKTADQAAADAEKATEAAAAKPAELSRTRGEHGSVTSLKQFWDFADLDRDKLDLETLRSYVPLDALEKAVRGFIKAGGRELTGVRIYENTRL